MRHDGAVVVFLLGLLLTTPDLRGEARPNIFGCGITWGAWLGLPWEQATEFDRRSMDKIVEMGGTSCGVNFAWIDIETMPGAFNWAYVDHQVNEALARGLEVFAYTGLTPDWALPEGVLDRYGSGIGYRFPPAEQFIPQFESFFRALAARYRGRVKYYQFWNEPNGCSWMNDDCENGHMAYSYVPWLQRWYRAMKQGDPHCVLAIGGLDYNAGVTHGYQYIEDIYAYGGGDSFDAVAIHPYGDPLHWQAITDTYNVLVSHGDGHKKLWLNEYGWDTNDEAAKAAKLTAVLNELKKPEYDMVFQASYLVITDLVGSGHGYGLCSRNTTTLTITPRQSWYAFRAVSKTWPVQADFSATPTSGKAPLTVQFTDLSTYPGATAWWWQFGDGGTSTQQHPMHAYQQPGEYRVSLTVSGPSGDQSVEKPGLIQVESNLPTPGVDNPGFEQNGGSLLGWDVVSIAQGPDRPPLSNGTYGVSTTDGTHWAGKITSWGTFDFRLGQVIGVTGFSPYSTGVTWELSALVQMASWHNTEPAQRPGNVHQVWEIGWNDDGSEPADISSCDHYQVIASIDGTYTGNHPGAFFPLTASGEFTASAMHSAVLRVRLYNDNPTEWSFSNIDKVSFAVTAAVPPVPGDRDQDRDVDGDDLVALQACRTGPQVAPVPDGCAWADFDGDNDVDQDDFGAFQQCITSEGVAGNPNCAGG